MSTRKFLFLDRDGVINSVEDGMVNRVSDFKFIEGVLEAIPILNRHFDISVVVTNQAGVGYGYLSQSTLEDIHDHMLDVISSKNGKIDKVYYCPDRVSKSARCRKPNTGMAYRAKSDFPQIIFEQSWMVGDRDTDIEFGNRLGMKTVFLTNTISINDINVDIKADLYFENLKEFAYYLNK